MTPFDTNNDLYFFYSTLLEGENHCKQRKNFCKSLNKLIIGLSSENVKCHCFVIFWTSPDLARKLAFFYSALIYFLKPLLTVELAYLLFCYGRLSNFLSCCNIKKYNMNRGACCPNATNLEWTCVSSINGKSSE